jgi:hypothetical protein
MAVAKGEKNWDKVRPAVSPVDTACQHTLLVWVDFDARAVPAVALCDLISEFEVPLKKQQRQIDGGSF